MSGYISLGFGKVHHTSAIQDRMTTLWRSPQKTARSLVWMMTVLLLFGMAIVEAGPHPCTRCVEGRILITSRIDEPCLECDGRGFRWVAVPKMKYKLDSNKKRVADKIDNVSTMVDCPGNCDKGIVHKILVADKGSCPHCKGTGLVPDNPRI